MSEQIFAPEPIAQSRISMLEQTLLADTEQEEPYASVIGIFKDDPMLDAMMANIRQRRQEVDADTSIE